MTLRLALAVILTFFTLFFGLFIVAAQAEQVDLELVIATDVSASINDKEAALQRQGIVAAFRDRAVVAAIRDGGGTGRIAVAYLEWSDENTTAVAVPWTVIWDHASALGFADRVSAAPRYSGVSTAIGHALATALEMIDGNAIQSHRQVIDISGDGDSNIGPSLAMMRDIVVLHGVVINGLPVVTPDADRVDIADYFKACVIGGRGSFSIAAKGYADFPRAMKRKLILEIAGLQPLPQMIVPVAFTPQPMVEC